MRGQVRRDGKGAGGVQEGHVRDLGNGELFECLTDGSLLCRYNKRFLALAICQNPRRKDIVVCSGYS